MREVFVRVPPGWMGMDACLGMSAQLMKRVTITTFYGVCRIDDRDARELQNNRGPCCAMLRCGATLLQLGFDMKSHCCTKAGEA